MIVFLAFNKISFAAEPLAFLAKADQVTLYEGFPHPLFEAKLLKAELKSKKTIEIDSYPFYQEILQLNQENTDQLKNLIGKIKDVTVGTKRCGGFHPDYAIIWHVDGKDYATLVCFSCAEVKFFEETSSVTYELNGFSDDFKNILQAYQKNRPKKTKSH